MNGCLEGHDSDTFNYGIKKHKFIANKKNGKTYLRFYDGIKSNAVTMEYVPSIPQKVRLMNNGQTQTFEITRLPEFHSAGVAGEFFRISGIPADDFPAEPIVIKIEW